MGKIESLGINGGVLRWVEEFLSDRTQQVCVNGINSNWMDVTSGIPQGSVLGPILFVLYINDLPTNIMSDVFMFADDTEMYRTIRGPNDQRILQADLDNLSTWSTKWLLKFHPDKCKIMHIGAETDFGGGGVHVERG